jgi:P27 family predicted phage terminase small subunit
MDDDALGLYCETYATYLEATRHIREDGMTQTLGSGRAMATAYIGIAAQAQGQLLRILAEFGMTPRSRAKIKTVKSALRTPQGEEKKNRFALLRDEQ